MKGFIILVLCMGLLIHSSSVAYATEDSNEPYQDYADALAGLGVFVGTGNGYELERAPTRTEGLIMLIRLIGVEDEAKSMHGSSTQFIDVPTWASGYVAFAYKEGLTKGVSATRFGSDQFLDAKAYITFLLRSLGYDDIHGDFSYEQSIIFAQSIGLIDSSLQNTILNNIFLRAHVAQLSYNTLMFPLKDSQTLLIDSLAKQGAIDSLAVNEFKSKMVSNPEVTRLKKFELAIIFEMVLDDIDAIEMGLVNLKAAAMSRSYSDYSGYLEMVEYFEAGKQAFIGQAGSEETRYALLNSISIPSLDPAIKQELDTAGLMLNDLSLCTLEFGNCVILCDSYIRSNSSEDYIKLVVTADSTLGKLKTVRNDIRTFLTGLNR